MENNGEKRRSVAIVAILLLLLLLGIGYAALTTTLNINGSATVKKQTWNIKFANPNVTTGSITAEGGGSIIPTVSGTTATYTITLEKPGDFYEFTIDVQNTGTINAKVGDTPIISGLSTEMDKVVNYTVTYEDGTEIKKDDKLDAGATKNFKVRVEYDTNITSETFNNITWTKDTNDDGVNDAAELTLTYSINYVQA